ncbi:MAG: coiled-coil domain-containing protein [Candidatus Thorarchaeota archaeon]
MATEKSDAAIKDIQKKVEKLAEDLTEIRDELKDVKSQVLPISKIDELISTVTDSLDKSLGKKLDDVSKSGDMTKKVDELAKSVTTIGSDVTEIKESKEFEVLIKKVDDVLVSTADIDVIAKKLDDLQGYIASLSGIEEKVQDLSSKFDETNEIVGIIVRQLDDIERKYNQASEKVAAAAEQITKLVEEGGVINSETDKTEKKPKEKTETKAPKVKDPTKASLPSTIDTLMEGLLDLVVPQTEASDMAEALEDVRDKLTTQIEGHTPVLFQFGKRARELKSYPPTATLNENDIASLSREIKSWTSKLKETAKG